MLPFFSRIAFLVQKHRYAITGAFICLAASLESLSQWTLPVYPDSLFSTYYHQRVTHFKSLASTKNAVVFLGNSITDGGEWSELFDDNRMKNRGISGDVSAGVLNRLDEVVRQKPSKVFLLIGTNDLARGVGADSLLKNMERIAGYLRQEAPSTQLYVQSILPVNDKFGKFSGHTGKAAQIKEVNRQLQEKAQQYGYRFVDLYAAFTDASGKLNPKFTNDGLHLTGEGYLLWKHLVYPHVYDAGQKPSLIPQPQSLHWQPAYFPLYACRFLVVKDSSLQKEAKWLQEKMGEKGVRLQVVGQVQKNEPYIELAIAKVEAPQLPEEAYALNVSDAKIAVQANTPTGVFHGLQTLLQLTRGKALVDGCAIRDWPAYAWRGYMIDVGRNYQSMDLIKQQIEIMSQYKLNIFHLHLTEDIAWRLAVQFYPQLTDPEHMLRNKGQFYSERDLKELIAYCKARHMTLIPEIDMPGHSAAFSRALNTGMQTDSGLAIVKNILREFCTTYDVPYIHIGADEVKITNKNFVPEVTAIIERLGKKVIGWEPGGNFTAGTIRQLWMESAVQALKDSNIQYVDSRHLYLNHMDPLESVVTIFNRQICGREKGSTTALGGIICVWPDRRVENEEDAFISNPVYPAMLAFAERSWQGGGVEGWVAHIGTPGSARAGDFAQFEQRLLDHKRQYFTGLPFPYVQQSAQVWKLYGPYRNEGDLSRKFDPETKAFDAKAKPAFETIGGTVVLRHWWHPLIRAAVEQPAENTTWYATTTIWSGEEQTGRFWIGFNNLSRSTAADSPLPGTWNNLQSAVWVNGKLIQPPHWKRGGQKGHPEVPLTDEGYEYRPPTEIALQKGWNTVLVKLPVGSFKGKDWQNPVKWMFTFVPAPAE